MVCYADDILIYMMQPTSFLPKLIQQFKQYGSFSGYKINLTKTQTLLYNYNPQKEMMCKYPMMWQAQSLRNVGINVPIYII